MTRRPDWHPSYGSGQYRKISRRSINRLQRVYDSAGAVPFPKEPTLRERQAAVRARLGIPEPQPHYRRRMAVAICLTVAAVGIMGVSGWAAFTLDAVALLIAWPALTNMDQWRDQ